MLGNRDVSVFHLPLRATFRDLASFGLPSWNPWVHGGQPILSNPSYGAFYPLSWLIFAGSAEYALTLMVVVHWAVAFAGAWFLARHFGCGRGAAALAAVGFTGCGAYLSLLSSLTLGFSLAWFPWLIALSDAAFRTPPGGRWRRPALLAGGALALQLLNGEPSTVLMSGLAVAVLAASAAARRPPAGLRIAVPVLLALALAAVQAVPTWNRLAESPRRALAFEAATDWSLPPVRMAEAVFPRVFGDPARIDEGFFFGWKVNDRHYPYVESLYPGLLLAVLGLSALIRGGIPRRGSWVLCCLAGLALALGRHDPAYAALRRILPGLAYLRYPERFVVLAVLALSMAGVLAWQRLLDERQAGRPEAADFPLALACLLLAVALTLALLLWWVPSLGLWWATTQGSPRLSLEDQAAALHVLRVESGYAVACAGAIAALLALCRWRRSPRWLLQVLAIALLAIDLWHYGHQLPRAIPVLAYRQPPPLVAALLPPRDRIFNAEGSTGRVEIFSAQGEPSTARYIPPGVARARPYSALLWKIPYAFETDFDLMLTRWGQQADEILTSERQSVERSLRFLGAWNVGTVLIPQAQGDPAQASPLRRLSNPLVLPRFRFVPEVTFHPDPAAALAAARAAGWRIARHEHWVRSGRPQAAMRYTQRPRLLEVRDEGGRIATRYSSQQGALFVAATTYDPGWRAELDGRPLAVYPTAACQIGVALPAGEHQLVLRYREPLLGTGAAVTLTALIAMAAVYLWPGRGRYVIPAERSFSADRRPRT